MNKLSINVTYGVGYNKPFINEFSADFDKAELFVGKSFSEGGSLSFTVPNIIFE